MQIQHYNNRKEGRPTERLTFKDWNEFQEFIDSIDMFIINYQTIYPDMDIPSGFDTCEHLKKLLDSLKRKVKLYEREGVKVPVTFINAEDYHLLTMAFIEAIGW